MSPKTPFRENLKDINTELADAMLTLQGLILQNKGVKREPKPNNGLYIYDTLERKVLPITASDGQVVRIYCCGPTVYRDAHVGNLRTFLLSDLVRRTLEFSGLKVKVVQNITDVGHMSEDFEEDKMLAQSKLEKRDPYSIAREYEEKFHKDLARLNILPAHNYPRASECIEMMLEHIAKLTELELAYQGDDSSIYFDSTKFDSYGQLSGNRLDALKPGHRYEYVEAGAKRFHADWALWKAAGNRREMIWQTAYGPGFPGWHIECSAMSLHYLQGHVDLHIGGIDLRFPHHENERAQSNPLVKGEAVSAWLHGEHLLFEGRKMSKSSGNVVLLSDVITRGFDPLSLRFCFLENRYRSQMDLSWNSISAAHSTLQRLRAKYQQWKLAPRDYSDEARAFVLAILAHFQADLDTPQVMIKLRSFEKDDQFSDGQKAAILENLEPLLALKLLEEMPIKELPDEARVLLEARQSARASKDFALSDQIRDQLLLLGISVSDSPSGQSWSWKS
jgi:cysteinyl-tRNA synthetase